MNEEDTIPNALEEYDDGAKSIAWYSYWEGFKYGYRVETFKFISYKAARTNFERMWKREME